MGLGVNPPFNRNRKPFISFLLLLMKSLRKNP